MASTVFEMFRVTSAWQIICDFLYNEEVLIKYDGQCSVLCMVSDYLEGGGCMFQLYCLIGIDQYVYEVKLYSGTPLKIVCNIIKLNNYHYL